ncbi:MAG: LysM peptidoglycan-binding domain-containing protein [Phascolarctobacterium sp.]|uniref:LysM peptidoglycan-binding domain-containing protein n=1 Tax=Phascolarctobacterium sp. TaxID=2049039 RepID=UPI0026DC5383|nr:LysM peptidoglycan-binding domain-containing protein [Phascolarctobacterium sp.]MDO4922182.1 LysM peptidoglycan-binding domain-containing protein [Phascolarctobacterium sp.]
MKRILFVLAFACMAYGMYGSAFADEPVYRNCSVTVAQGDTLWDIAWRHTENKEDVREVMHRISRANALKSRHIYPGQVLQVPMRVQDSGLMVATK